jgi:plasmid maintenance system antidote protein VapI
MPPESARDSSFGRLPRRVAADTAMRLGRYFGTSAEFCLNLQTMHDLTRVQAERGATIKRDVRSRAA